MFNFQYFNKFGSKEYSLFCTILFLECCHLYFQEVNNRFTQNFLDIFFSKKFYIISNVLYVVSILCCLSSNETSLNPSIYLPCPEDIPIYTKMPS